MVPCPFGSGGYLLRFLNDQQGCVFWYLYLTSRGEHCVVASLACLDWEIAADDEEHGIPDTDDAWEDPPLEAVTVCCAPSFETFLYRFWLENEIWCALYKKDRALTMPEQPYLQQYRSE